MSKPYKLVYNIVDNDIHSKDYGYLLEKVLKFASHVEASDRQRVIANTTPNLVGTPVLIFDGDDDEAR